MIYHIVRAISIITLVVMGCILLIGYKCSELERRIEKLEARP